MKLDKKQGYGLISGSHHGATFEQDGHLFDANGDEIVVADVPDEPVGAEQGTVPAAAAPATKAKAQTKTAAAPAPAKSHKKKVAEPVVAETPAVQASPVDSQLAAQGL